MRRGSWYREPWRPGRFESPRPRAVAGGIKADVRGRASFQTWWARRWIEMLEQFGQGARLSRGRSYARLGQVRSLAVEPGKITAVVQGTKSTPYDVTIAIPVFAPDRWRAAIQPLPGQLLAAARLLAGDICVELEAAFRDARASLVPEHSREIVTTCNCHEATHPCKHVAAVHYVFGAEIERDPFLLFRLRGIERDELLAALTGADASVVLEPRSRESEEPKAPLSADPTHFFRAGPLPPLDLHDLRIPSAPAAQLQPLGNLPFWRGASPLADALAPIYRAASIAACALCLGEKFETP